ncbi:hypothetical protein [Wenjunlia tyrosinilytica]|uniref:hypothetical protein n=1 Tax=Wenjunlia tyrosinilytica TaxID=1544741 RepID=UPI00166D254B|nr:hypothetical protein [Wenjunlia tyrosinilytica]
MSVDYYALCLEEADDELVPVPWPDDWEGVGGGGPFLTARECRLDIVSGGHTHTARVEAEIWDAQPDPDVSTLWEAQAEAEIFCPSGELTLSGLTRPMQKVLHLGTPGRRWGVRVHCAGRENVHWEAQLDVPRGVEQYLVQFWPLGA